MKNKEQLADEHINDEYPKDLYSTDERSDAQMTFLAGYDARDAQLKELPEFDEATVSRDAIEQMKLNVAIGSLSYEPHINHTR